MTGFQPITVLLKARVIGNGFLTKPEDLPLEGSDTSQPPPTDEFTSVERN